MKVIFLDIDGVLNTQKTFKDIHDEYQVTHKRRVELDEKKIFYLSEIVRLTGANIVLSSSWRIFGHMEDGEFIPTNKRTEELKRLFAKYNMVIYDMTSFLGSREEEIREWLSCHNAEEYLIIDDETFNYNEEEMQRLIKTNFYLKYYPNIGLGEQHIEEAVKKLTLKR